MALRLLGDHAADLLDELVPAALDRAPGGMEDRPVGTARSDGVLALRVAFEVGAGRVVGHRIHLDAEPDDGDAEVEVQAGTGYGDLARIQGTSASTSPVRIRYSSGEPVRPAASRSSSAPRNTVLPENRGPDSRL